MIEQFSNIFTQMVILFLAMGVGYACKKANIIDEVLDKKLSSLVLNATLPCLILSSVLACDSLPEPIIMLEVIGLSLLSFVILIAVAFLVTFVLRIPDGGRGIFRFIMIFGNTGFIGYPVITAILGSQYVIYAVVYNLPFNFIVFTLGAWLIASDNPTGVKVRVSPKTFVNPCNIASVCAMALAFLGVHSVPVIGDSLTTIGNFTTPATLLIVGSSLANLPVKRLFGGPRLFVASITRLVVTPLIIFAVMRTFLSGWLLTMLVILAAMPVATNGTMLCYQYNGDAKTMAQGTFITTVFSLVTIPMLVILASGI